MKFWNRSEKDTIHNVRIESLLKDYERERDIEPEYYCCPCCFFFSQW